MNNLDNIISKFRINFSNNNYSTINIVLTYYTLFLIILNYIVPINVIYSLFSIIILKQVFFSYYKYKKYNKTINLVEFIGSIIAFIGLAILLLG